MITSTKLIGKLPSTTSVGHTYILYIVFTLNWVLCIICAPKIVAYIQV